MVVVNLWGTTHLFFILIYMHGKFVMLGGTLCCYTQLIFCVLFVKKGYIYLIEQSISPVDFFWRTWSCIQSFVYFHDVTETSKSETLVCVCWRTMQSPPCAVLSTWLLCILFKIIHSQFMEISDRVTVIAWVQERCCAQNLYFWTKSYMC